VLELLCALAGVDDAVGLDVRFLTGGGSARSNTLAVGNGADGLCSSGSDVGIRVEVVTGS
jgi:hypothetical protein